MAPPERPTARPDATAEQPPVPCSDCRAALASPSRETVSFLLLDQFTLPVAGCEDHLEQFRAVCGLTTSGRARLLAHLPAGGITCPSCRLSSHGTRRAMIPVDGGAAVLLGCPEHQSTIASRFQAGRETQNRLCADFETFRS
ncbi:hypothetical protein NDI56_18435 [Haloarcula sp. S1CR25-12]|uniref:Uncharacterized protein n=1 Tax=Haloarcula saliterrae TaxID=2950534 RepID=A0ABU2FGK4_9EURY|nr:hypothetical protein [Haloarcula sp. S1CR25-12]MDS0261383.1 hypothetical protein [Haloarcula sp. S1CR25-12]